MSETAMVSDMLFCISATKVKSIYLSFMFQFSLSATWNYLYICNLHKNIKTDIIFVIE